MILYKYFFIVAIYPKESYIKCSYKKCNLYGYMIGWCYDWIMIACNDVELNKLLIFTNHIENKWNTKKVDIQVW